MDNRKTIPEEVERLMKLHDADEPVTVWLEIGDKPNGFTISEFHMRIRSRRTDRFRKIRRETTFLECYARTCQTHDKRDDPLEVITKSELCSKVRAIVDSLPPHFREAVQRIKLNDESLKSVAESLGKKPKTVKNWLIRGLQRIRERLHGYEELA